MALHKSADPNIFILPDLGEGVHEAELIAWKVKEGETVEEHQIVAEMETDKALVEVPSPRAGTIKQLFGKVGEILKVGEPAWTYEGAGTVETKPSNGHAPAAQSKQQPSRMAESSGEREDDGTVVGTMSGELGAFSREGGKALATPAVRRLARDLGIDIDAVPGSGIGGRVTEKDVRAFKGGGGGGAKPSAPAAIIRMIPKTWWWTWSPPSLTMLPGHKGTFGLRINRVLNRMKANETRKPTRTRKIASW